MRGGAVSTNLWLAGINMELNDSANCSRLKIRVVKHRAVGGTTTVRLIIRKTVGGNVTTAELYSRSNKSVVPTCKLSRVILKWSCEKT